MVHGAEMMQWILGWEGAWGYLEEMFHGWQSLAGVHLVQGLGPGTRTKLLREQT